MLTDVKNISDILMEVEFKGLTPLEYLLKIFKENEKAKAVIK
jgi:hypothetical protein